MKKLNLIVTTLFIVLCVIHIQAQYNGYYRTPSGNTNYHHFIRNGGGAAVYINQQSTDANHPILRLSSGTATANQNMQLTVENDGKVGIGTISPDARLHITDDSFAGILLQRTGMVYDQYRTRMGIYGIEGQINTGGLLIQTSGDGGCHWNDGLYIDNAGRIGIGTKNLSSKVHIKQGDNVPNEGICFESTSGSSGFIYRAEGISGSLIFRNVNQNTLFIGDGKVGIGADNPSSDAALYVNGDALVNGSIKTEHLKVTTDISAAGNIEASNILLRDEVPQSDYVFEPDYYLMELTELEDYVKKNKHLPEIPSASEFKEKGYNVGQMDDLLLRKVEELTLYILELQGTIKEQNTRIENLESR